MEEEKLQRYLGDGVYAVFEGGGIWLHANDHINPTDRVYLESDALSALNKFVEDIKNRESA